MKMLKRVSKTSVDVFSHILKRPGLLVILIFSSAFYVSGVFYGLPQEFNADEFLFMDTAVDMVQNRTLDPGWYGVPAQLLICALAVIIGVVAVFGMLLGVFSSPEAAGQLFLEDPSIFYILGRLISAFFAVICIWLTDRLIRTFDVTGHWRWIALATLCLAKLYVSLAIIIRMDMMQTSFMLVTLLMSIHALRAPNPMRSLIIAGAFVGLAVTSKFPGVIGAVPVVLSAVLLFRNGDWTWGEAIKGLIYAGLASIAAAFLSGPYLFLNFAGMLQDVLFEARNYHLGATGAGIFNQLFYYVFVAIPAQIGIFGLLAGVIGLAFLCVEKRQGILVASLAVAYLIFISTLSLQWERWILPVLPLVCVGIAVAGHRVEGVLQSKIQSSAYKMLGTVVAAAILLTPIVTSAIPTAWAKANNKDTRVQALIWINENIPEASNILTESYAPALDSMKYSLFVPRLDPDIVLWSTVSKRHRPYGYYGSLTVNWGSDPSVFIDRIDELEIDYVVLTDQFISRFAKEQGHQAQDSIQIYETIFAEFELVKEFSPSGLVLGPEIQVLRRSVQ